MMLLLLFLQMPSRLLSLLLGFLPLTALALAPGFMVARMMPAPPAAALRRMDISFRVHPGQRTFLKLFLDVVVVLVNRFQTTSRRSRRTLGFRTGAQRRIDLLVVAFPDLPERTGG